MQNNTKNTQRKHTNTHKHMQEGPTWSPALPWYISKVADTSVATPVAALAAAAAATAAACAAFATKGSMHPLPAPPAALLAPLPKLAGPTDVAQQLLLGWAGERSRPALAKLWRVCRARWRRALSARALRRDSRQVTSSLTTCVVCIYINICV
jgi:hypothetical protein